MKKVFCECCHRDTPYTTTEETMIGVVNDSIYMYKGKIAHCKICDNEVFVPEINDYNLEKLNQAKKEMED